MSDASAASQLPRHPVVAITTDFGVSSPYVGQMKGVLLSGCPGVQLIDVTHAVPPQDVAGGALVLADCCRWFPPGTVHLAVVDPGVGTERRILAVQVRDQRFVFPDNGLITLLASPALFPDAASLRAVAVDPAAAGDAAVSTTFHGRDIMAPLAARLAQGAPLEELGEPIDNWIALDLLPTPLADGGIRGRVLWIDDFGNIITNVRGDALPQAFRVEIAGRRIVDHVRTYGERQPASLVTLIGSSGWLEVAAVNGSAAAQLSVTSGTDVCLYAD